MWRNALTLIHFTFFMRIIFAGALLALLSLSGLQAQSLHTLQGHVTDEKGISLPGATLFIRNKGLGVSTDERGGFTFDRLAEGVYTLEISYLGYQMRTIEVSVPATKKLHISLRPAMQTLSEVVVRDSAALRERAANALSVEHVDASFITRHLTGNLMKTLDRLPGVDAIGIGSGQSKPVIRGLGFNRVVVVTNGVRHESQQWGADHGLEVDQFAVSEVDVIKGPASLMYGSDAIGGVIELKPEPIPESCSVSGNAMATWNSNNGLLGGSVLAALRKTNYFLSVRASLTDFGDYRVPADYVNIQGYRAALDKHRLRNTAGDEQNAHLTFGFIGKSLTNKTYLGLLRQKQGFFANAHGLEPRRVDTLLHDKSGRDIQYPFQQVQHLMVVNTTEVFRKNLRLTAELGFQHNHREEFSAYVSHGYMPAVFPDGLPFAADLERAFNKSVASANLRMNYALRPDMEISTGLNVGYQDNQIDGRGFIIPVFRQLNAGFFGFWKQQLGVGQQLQAGLRLETGYISTDAYHDWFTSPTQVPGVADNALRADALSRSFNTLIWSAGYSQLREHLEWKVNLGKSFRMPIAKELAANGVNYHHFSYEIGDPDLNPEIAYQLDLGAEWHTKWLAFGLTPFVSYFTNYIYLNPGYEHDTLYGSGNQVFRYTQNEVFRAGAEVHAHINLTNDFRLGLIGDYVYSLQTSGDKKGFGLPFAPPLSVLLNMEYRPAGWRWFSEPYLSADVKWSARQHRVVPPEEPTPAYYLVNVAAGGNFHWNNRELTIALQLQNLFNTKYFNHTSYYRLINAPEAGRSVMVTIKIPFFKNIDSKI